MLPFLRLIRLPNLLIVAASQYLLRHFLWLPALGRIGAEWQRNHALFAAFVGMTVAAAAGGYIINDILDEAIDRINKPEKTFVGTYFSRQAAIYYYIGSILVGLGCAFFLYTHTHYAAWLVYFGSATALLYVYSRWLKQRVLIGNIVVAIFTACVAWGIALPLAAQPAAAAYQQAFIILQSYCFFAFFVNLWREIVKDMEDIAGDSRNNCQTLPIRYGIYAAKWCAAAAAVLLLLGILFFGGWLVAHNCWYCLVWLVACLFFPILSTLFLLAKAEQKADFHFISTAIKFIMLAGLLFLVVYGAEGFCSANATIIF